MNRNLVVAIALVLSVPAFVFAQSAVKNQQRQRRCQVLQQTTQQMMQLTLSINQYSQDNKGKMPPMQNPAVLKRALQRYAGKDAFISKASGQPFISNANLSGKPLAKSNLIVWCYDPKPFLLNPPKDLYRVVGFSNSTIAMPERRWQSAKKTAGLP